MAARKKKATKKATKKGVKRAPVRAKTQEAEAEAPAAGAKVVVEKRAKKAPVPPSEATEAPRQSPAEVKEDGRVWRILVQVDNSLYSRLRAIAQRENALFPGDEELSIAQQAAVLLEAGVTMWEEDGEEMTGDGYLDDPDYTNALSAAMTGKVIKQR